MRCTYTAIRFTITILKNLFLHVPYYVNGEMYKYKHSFEQRVPVIWNTLTRHLRTATNVNIAVLNALKKLYTNNVLGVCVPYKSTTYTVL